MSDHKVMRIVVGYRDIARSHRQYGAHGLSPRHYYEAVRLNSPRALCVTLTARWSSAATRATLLVRRRRIVAGRGVTTTLDTGRRSQPRERQQSPRSEGPLAP